MNKKYKTEGRSRILEVLQKADGAMSVPEIQRALEAQETSVNKTTIYRYMDTLEESGVVMKYADGSGKKATYQYVDRSHKCDQHLHLKCVECGEVIHLDCDFMGTIAEHVYSDHGFMIQCRNSMIYGLCKTCMSKNWDG